MPELPEVETTRAGIAPYLEDKIIRRIHVHNASLRWPVPESLLSLQNERVISVDRRAKYILIGMANSSLIVHLGMSGSLRLCEPGTPKKKHDHVEFELADWMLRFNDPRRFGCVLQTTDVSQHALICALGPEPLEPEFDADYLHAMAKGRKTSIKQFIMNGKIVVGVGNIYANEALFMSGISPKRAAGRISFSRMERLVLNIKQVLNRSITRGGTTLRDFVGSDGSPGYFKQQLFVYGRQGEPCKQCGDVLKEIRQNNRSTVYCQSCQI